MVLPITSFFSLGTTAASVSNRPMFTSIPTSDGVLKPSRIHAHDYKHFWRQFKNSPELVGTLSVPITDIIGDRPAWTSTDGAPLGKTQLRKAIKFWRDNRGKETIRAFLFDAFLTGDGFLWKGKPTTKEVNSAVKEVMKKMSHLFEIQTKEQLQDIAVKASLDEDLKKPKKIDYVASSSVTIIHDAFEIKKYEQNANGKLSIFQPDEIIHFRYMTLNGMVEGFSPVQALAAEIMLLSLVKNNMTSFLNNGGTPDKVFILPKEIANSKNHKYLIDQLRKYKMIHNAHGNLVFTGDMDVKDLQGSPKDLEYKDLALYITSNIAFAFGIPVTRIPYLIGSSASKGDSGGLSESGYWNKISDLQDSVEDLLNSQLFDSLGWNIRFIRGYKQDEVREAQTKNQNADTVAKYQSILSGNELQMNQKKILEMLDFTQGDVEKFKVPEAELQNTMMGQNQMSKSSTIDEPDKQKRDQGKRQANENQKKATQLAAST